MIKNNGLKIDVKVYCVVLRPLVNDLITIFNFHIKINTDSRVFVG
jgi:hypothetical protein